MPTITADIGADTTSPLLIVPWSTEQDSANVFHDIQGATMPWVSIQGARARRGELALFYGDDEAAAAAAREMLSEPDTFTIDYDQRPSLEFTFAVDGTVRMELDEQTSDHWVVRFGYREVA